MKEREKYFFTILALGTVSVATGLFLRGALPPTQAAGLQRFDRTFAESLNRSTLVHGHDNIAQHDHRIIVITTVTETSPHGNIHGFGRQLAPWVFQKETLVQQGTHEVWIFGREFTPNTLTVPAGTRVTWVNKSSEQHTVSSNSSLFASFVYIKGSIADSFSYTFTAPGTYNYYCQPHTGMTGKIVVTPQ